MLKYLLLLFSAALLSFGQAEQFPIRVVTANPGTCVSYELLYNTTTQSLYVCRPGNSLQKHVSDDVASALNSKTIDGGLSTTTHAAGANFLSSMRHATDCTAVTDGKAGELCWESDANRFYVCEPSAGDCDTAGEWTQDTDNSGGTPAWESLVNSADSATSYTSNATAETVTFSFESAFGASQQFLVRQQTGNPTAGTLLDVRAADAQVTVFRAGDGTNGITVSQAGALTAEGTGAITATLGDSATSFFASGAVESDRIAATLTGKTIDGGVATTTHAAGANFISVVRHATDCTAITDGIAGELCVELDAERLYSCQPTAGGCDTAAEWILTGDGAGGGNSFGTIGAAVADVGADALTVTDSGTIDFTTTDNPEDLTAAVIANSVNATHIDETAAYAWSSTTSTYVGASYTSGSADPADAGVLRCGNNTACVAWELATPGVDKTLIVDAADILQFNGTSNATTLTESANAVPNATDHLGFFASTTTAQLAGVISDETGSGVLVLGTSPTITTSLTQDGDAADAGYLRLQNAALIAWEASPAGADITLSVDASEIMQSSGTFNAATLTEGGTAVPNTGDNLSVFAATTSAQLAGVLSNETGTGAAVFASSPAVTIDGAVATTSHAAGASFISALRHATDCTAITDGLTGELCVELDSERLFSCQPTAGGCDTAAEWILTGDGAGGGNGFGTIGAGVADAAADTMTVTDGLGIDFTTTDNPEDLTAELNYSQTLAGNPGLAVSSAVFSSACSGGGFLSEGSTANTNEQLYCFPAVDGADTTKFLAVDTTEVQEVDGAFLTITSGTLDVDGVAAGTNGIEAFNAGDNTTLARSDHTHRQFMSISWFLPGSVVSGTQNIRGLVPEGVTNCTITNSRITVATTASTNTTWNIHRCTTAAGDCTATADIYSAAVTLNSSTQSVAGGAPNTATITAGDAFRVNITPGTSLQDATITMTYKCENIN